MLSKVWGLSQTATGLHVKFSTTATSVHVKVTTKAENGDWLWAINGHSGVDMYVQDTNTSGKWRWATSTGNNPGATNGSMHKTPSINGDATFTATLGVMATTDVPRNFTLYLPSRGVVKSVSVGVEPGSMTPKVRWRRHCLRRRTSLLIEKCDCDPRKEVDAMRGFSFIKKFRCQSMFRCLLYFLFYFFLFFLFFVFVFSLFFFIKALAAPPADDKPVVVYGTSILHGAAAGRAGMVYSSQMQRYLQKPVVNLGDLLLPSSLQACRRIFIYIYVCILILPEPSLPITFYLCTRVLWAWFDAEGSRSIAL